MSQRRVVVYVCDLCGTDDLVQTHRVVVDGQARDAEACDECWSRTLSAFSAWATSGRAPLRKKTKTTDAVSWPDTAWRFTSHALLRMGERKVSPAEVIRCVDRPELRRPGKATDQEIWTRGNTKVVVVPYSQVIVTVAHQNEDVDVLPVAI